MPVTVTIECPECSDAFEVSIDFDKKEIRSIDKCPACAVEIEEDTMVEFTAEAISDMVLDFALKLK